MAPFFLPSFLPYPHLPSGRWILSRAQFGRNARVSSQDGLFMVVARQRKLRNRDDEADMGNGFLLP